MQRGHDYGENEQLGEAPIEGHQQYLPHDHQEYLAHAANEAHEGHEPHEGHFDSLLDCSLIDQQHPGHFFEHSKDKLNLSEKERTREESYQEITRQINHSKVEQAQLRKELDRMKQQTYRNYLSKFEEEFHHLNQENQLLRKELNHLSVKKREDKNERLSNRSSMKVRSSINSVFGDQNKRTHTKLSRKEASPNMVLMKKDVKLTESSAFLGRSHVHSPLHHKRRESQLTERKNEENNNSKGISFNESFADDKASEWNYREHASKQYLKPQPEQKNIFVEILQKMLKEEQIQDNEKYAEIYLESTRPQLDNCKEQVTYLHSVEKEIKETSDKLEMLNLVTNQYQAEIKGLNININAVTELTSRLFEVKGKYVEMERKCEDLLALRKEVSHKQGVLASKRQEMDNEKEECKSIASVQTLIKIFTNNPHKTFPSQTSSVYGAYYREIKELFKFDREDQVKRQQKMVKVKDMIDTIRASRKKFNELIAIYEGRIAKLEEKIGRVRKLPSQSAKSSQK